MATNKREARLQQLALTRFAVRHERQIRRAIAQAMAKVANNLGDTLIFETVEAEHSAAVDKLLKNLWNESSELMYGLLFAQEAKRFSAQLLPTVTANAIAADYIRQFGLERVTQITRTTIDDIKRVVISGIADGMTEKEIAAQILALAPTKSASRAQTISRTETHASANFAAQSAVESTGIQMRKQWVTAIDDRTRDGIDSEFDHVAVDGQTVSMDQPFDVNGEQLMYPGDPSGSPGNVINCRCAVVYIV